MFDDKPAELVWTRRLISRIPQLLQIGALCYIIYIVSNIEEKSTTNTTVDVLSFIMLKLDRLSYNMSNTIEKVMLKLDRLSYNMRNTMEEAYKSYKTQLSEINKQLCIEKHGKEKCEIFHNNNLKSTSSVHDEGDL